MENITFSSITADEIIQLLEDPIKKDWYSQYLKIQREAPIKELINALWSSNKALTSRILCDMLGARRAKSAIPALLNCLNHRFPFLRDNAAEAIAKIGSPKAGEDLLKHFQEENRYWYAVALGAINYQPAIPYLIDALNSDSGDLRGGAAWSLGVMKAKNALSVLENALREEIDYYAIERMQEAIESIRSDILL